jgi:hypothetical protein
LRLISVFSPFSDVGEAAFATHVHHIDEEGVDRGEVYQLRKAMEESDEDRFMLEVLR